MMTGWPVNELSTIAHTDDRHISPWRADGVAPGTPAPIWSVVGGEPYVQAHTNQFPRRYQAALRQRAGRITAAGATPDVTFGPVAGEIQKRIDDAYREKYAGSPYVAPMTGFRAATIGITPRNLHTLSP